MEDQMLFDNLDEKLEDETSVVTTKWISVNFKLPIGKSERLLDAYFHIRKELHAIYMLAGTSPSGDVLVTICPVSELSQVRMKFSSPPVEKIYSVHRQPLQSSSTLANLDSLLDLNTDSLKQLVRIPWQPIDAVQTSVLGHKYNELPSEVKSKPVPVITQIHTDGRDNVIKTENVKNFFAPSKKSVDTEKKQPIKRPSNFFSTRPEKSARTEAKNRVSNNVSTNVVPDTEPEVAPVQDDSSPVKPARASLVKRKRIVIESDEEDDSTLIERNEPKCSAKQVAKRGEAKENVSRLVLAADSEADSPSTPARSGRRPKPLGKSQAPNSVNVADPSQQPRKKKETTNASISNMDRALDSDKSHKLSGRALPMGKRNRIRRHVIKTFTDEDGFMVTEKVWESVSENEEEENKEEVDDDQTLTVNDSPKPVETVIATNDKKSSTQLTNAPSVKPQTPKATISKQGKKIAPKASKQASLSSFFKST